MRHLDSGPLRHLGLERSLALCSYISASRCGHILHVVLGPRGDGVNDAVFIANEIELTGRNRNQVGANHEKPPASVTACVAEPVPWIARMRRTLRSQVVLWTEAGHDPFAERKGGIAFRSA